MSLRREPPRLEVEEAFAHWWSVGNVEEDWWSWADLFVPNVFYVDHFWGPLQGKEQVRRWIEPVMKGVPEIYAVLDWYRIDGDAVTFHYQNRRDNPDPDGPSYFDFAGLSVIWYAGDGLWRAEEDFWDHGGARATSIAYAEACQRVGAEDIAARLSRRHWPPAPAWARCDHAPRPSWLERDGLAAITRPAQLRRVLDAVGPEEDEP